MAGIFSFSIVIPSYNEGDDIRLSVESAITQEYPHKEILVVDDSTDSTPQIVVEYASQGVHVLQGERRGCCEARNKGMHQASGDVVVLLNADVVLPPDFLSRVKAHYDAGADYVLVESRVFNVQKLFARFVEAQHVYESRKIGARAEWTEGFSCRRDAAIAVGLIPGNFPVRFCRDWMLGKALSEAEYKKVIDLSIVVTHKAPEHFEEYWRVRKARGRFGALGQRFLFHRSQSFLAVKFFLKDATLILKILLVIPAAVRAYRISRRAPRALRDFFLFFYAYVIQECARAIGEWEGWRMIKAIY